MSVPNQIPTWLLEPIIGADLALMFNRLLKPSEALEQVPAYLFDIVMHDGNRVGQIDLRMGNNHNLCMFAGQIGYGIDRRHRGYGYAAEACKLLESAALHLGFTGLWITCNPDNLASIRTCENIGAYFVEQVQVPRSSELWQRGDREKLRYYWPLSSTGSSHDAD